MLKPLKEHKGTIMNKELESQLSSYLGELLFQHENNFVWNEKNEIKEKINAVSVLLGIEPMVNKSVNWKEILSHL